MKEGKLPTVAELVAGSDSGSFDDYGFNLKTGGAVRLGFPGARSQSLAFTDGVKTAQATDLAQAAGRTRGFGDFWQHALVAQGSVDVAIEPEVSLWDLAALLVIVEEAGGRFTDLSGFRTAAGGNVISSNGILHEEALSRIGAGSARA